MEVVTGVMPRPPEIPSEQTAGSASCGGSVKHDDTLDDSSTSTVEHDGVGASFVVSDATSQDAGWCGDLPPSSQASAKPLCDGSSGGVRDARLADMHLAFAHCHDALEHGAQAVAGDIANGLNREQIRTRIADLADTHGDIHDDANWRIDQLQLLDSDSEKYTAALFAVEEDVRDVNQIPRINECLHRMIHRTKAERRRSGKNAKKGRR